MKYMIFALSLAAISACGSDRLSAAAQSEVGRVEVFPADTLVFTPDYVQMRAIVYDTLGHVIDKRVTWTVVDEAPVAFVDSTGLVRPNTQHRYVYIKATADAKSSTGRIFWTTGTTN